MKRFKICGVLVLICNLVFSQIPDFKTDYKPLRSSGTLPDIYTRSASEKINEDLDKLNKSKSEKNKSVREVFYKSSNYHQDRLLRSGIVLFNDPISVYVNKVADEIFKNDKALRMQLQIFIVKSDVVNAFCFDNGIILVNTGLIAQLDNEAQLAYILSHEASHFVKKHSIEGFVKSTTSRGRYRTSLDIDEYKYSQEAETEADVNGVKIFRESKYTYKGIVGAFNVLKYSYLPFDEVVFDKKFLEDTNFVFPTDYFLKELSPIKKEEDYDDSKSTHPNIKKRKEAAGKELGEFSDEGREKFIVGQDEFNKVREIARFEGCRLNLLYKDYVPCIYNCYLLLKKYPENVYLKTTLGKALFEIAAFKCPRRSDYLNVLNVDFLNNEYTPVDYYYSDKEGNVQQVYHLFNKMSSLQSNVLALNYNWKLKKELKSNDPSVNRICDSLFVLLALHNETDISYFNRTSRGEYINQLKGKNMTPTDSAKSNATPVKKLSSLADLDDTDKDTKASRIEEQVKKSEINDLSKKDSVSTSKLEMYFDKYAFADHLKDDDFTRSFKRAIAVKEAYDAKTKDYKKKGYTRNKGGLGIDKIVLLDPFYLKLDERNGGSIKYFATDEKLDQFGEILKTSASVAGLQYDFIDSKSIKKDEIERYNDFTNINDWMTEFLNHDFNPNSIVLSNDASKLIKEKYNTKYVLWSGVVNMRIKKENVGAALLATFLLYPAPFTIPYLLRKEERTFYVSILYNVENNKVQYYNTVSLKMADTRDFLSSFAYDTMLKIKKQPKYVK